MIDVGNPLIALASRGFFAFIIYIIYGWNPSDVVPMSTSFLVPKVLFTSKKCVSHRVYRILLLKTVK